MRYQRLRRGGDHLVSCFGELPHGRQRGEEMLALFFFFNGGFLGNVKHRLGVFRHIDTCSSLYAVYTFFCTHTFHYFLLLGPSLFWTTFCSQDDFSDGSCDWQDCLHVGSTAWTSGDGGNLASKRLEPAAGRKRWASWKKGPFLLFRGFVGDELLPSLRGDYNGCKDPYETTRIQWKVRGVFSWLRWVRSGEEFDL